MSLRAVIVAARELAVARLYIGFGLALRLRIAKCLSAAQWEYVATLKHARITQMMSADIQMLGFGILFVLQGLAAAAMLLAQCLTALFIAPGLAAILICLLAFGVFALRPMIVRARKLGGYLSDANLELLNSNAQFLGGLKLAISQNLESSYVEETRQALEHLASVQISYRRQYVYGQAALTSMSALVGIALVLAGTTWLQVSAPVLITLLLIVSRATAPVGQIQQGAQEFAHVLAVYEKVQELVAELTFASGEAREPTGSMSLPDGPIVFERVTYRHGRESKGGVGDLDLAIQPGEFLGITGASGAGKTTFADLLAGLYPPQAGRILIGGHVFANDMLVEWRRRLSYISQDPFLFHDTIRRNLVWANPLADEDAMWRALDLAGARSLIQGMEKRLDSIVGERGTLVSGGERQRIALARALLREPRLLILDEATSAIDSNGERDVLVRLRDMSKRPTIVLIAHRTENLSICDRVITFGATQ
jgi:ATP-binding cassette subfamily C protein